MDVEQEMHIREIAELIEREIIRVVKLRDNPEGHKGRARHSDIVCHLGILEVTLGFAAQALHELLGEKRSGPSPGATEGGPSAERTNLT